MQMKVYGFRYYESSNYPESKEILAHSKEEAEKYLRVLVENGLYKIKNLAIEHSYEVATPTNYKVFSRSENGLVTSIDWYDKEGGRSGRVGCWTELPPRIKHKAINKEQTPCN